jgi:hypothetical protein
VVHDVILSKVLDVTVNESHNLLAVFDLPNQDVFFFANLEKILVFQSASLGDLFIGHLSVDF